jgi:hypothetical protein
VSRLGSLRNVVVIALLSLAVLPACSSQAPRQTQEQQETANRPTRSVSKTSEALDEAGGATLAVVVVGVLVGVAILPVLLIVLL